MSIISSCFKSRFPSRSHAGEARGVVFDGAPHSRKGIVIVHDRTGLNDDMAMIGCRLATQGGFTVLALDLFNGRRPSSNKDAAKMTEALNLDDALLNIHAAVRCLFERGCTKVGVMGFATGGVLTFMAGTLSHVSAIAPFYGIPREQRGLANIKIPIQAHFGQKDEMRGFSSPNDYSVLREKLLGAGVNFDLQTHDAGHDFVNSNTGNYDGKATDAAMAMVLKFFTKNLA